jgi:hypothetical protein
MQHDNEQGLGVVAAIFHGVLWSADEYASLICGQDQVEAAAAYREQLIQRGIQQVANGVGYVFIHAGSDKGSPGSVRVQVDMLHPQIWQQLAIEAATSFDDRGVSSLRNLMEARLSALRFPQSSTCT